MIKTENAEKLRNSHPSVELVNQKEMVPKATQIAIVKLPKMSRDLVASIFSSTEGNVCFLVAL